ncbi:hypothetical protein JTE90_009892 [Oedothorax gibbosus]|uniref:Prokineticin domain-containing protein n=1 Tax=Oedothorax gibbosus TaxID=931172 RepID=A0AAV6UWG5_9ARAC|nr:hypothetical protein JTE90_009892 [Oedothorax gibbosus]
MKTFFSTLLLLVFVAKGYGLLICDDETDCEVDECCVFEDTDQMLGKGVCRKLERPGTQCNEPDAAIKYYGSKFLFRCPCKEGLDCQPTGICRNGACDVHTTVESQRCTRVKL